MGRALERISNGLCCRHFHYRRVADPWQVCFSCSGRMSSSGWNMTANRDTRWLVYTVLIGLIPVVCRVLVWIISQNRASTPFNAADFILFGLVLHISIINRIEHLDGDQLSWKTNRNTASIAFIIIYAVLFTSDVLGQANPGLINSSYVLVAAPALCLISLALSISVYQDTAKEHRI